METIRIEGIEYQVTGTRAFEVEGKQRTHLRLRRLNGNVSYCAVKYETGKVSSAVRVG